MVLLGIIAAAGVILLISKWWTDGQISGVEFFLLSGVYGLLAFGLFAVSSSGIGAMLLVLIPILISVGWALYCNQKLGIRQYYKDKIRHYEDAIRADPRNYGARSMMAEAYYMLGDLDSAIAAMELAVQTSPSAAKENYRMRQWVSERELRDSKTLICQVCNSKNLWGASQCRTCLQPLAYPEHAKWKNQPGATSRMWLYAAIGAIWLVLAVISFVILKPQQAAIVVVCGTLAATGWLLLSTSKA